VLRHAITRLRLLAADGAAEATDGDAPEARAA
jgi:hypothetical protein